MKTKRFLSAVLALLLVCSLPVSAFAVNDNPADGTVTEIPTGDTMNTNYGTVGTNNGVVSNNGTVDNHDNAKVDTNNGTVVTNYGTVDTNTITGTVTNVGGTVDKNYGTVIDEKGNDERTTRYGVQVVGENDGKPIQAEKNSVVDLTQFTKEGHVLTGYIQGYQMGENGPVRLDGLSPVNKTSYIADCPNVLTLIWQAISSGSGGNAADASDGAADFGSSIYFSINGHKYMLVAVVEDVYCLASVESYEAEELADLPALLASLLTEEQLGYVTGEVELLDEELTARFFAGRGSHIVIPCDKGLIFF